MLLQNKRIIYKICFMYARDNDDINDLYPDIDLYLPKNQEVMEFDENSKQYIWKPTGESYFAGSDKDNVFLGYQFMSVKKWE